MQEMYAFWGIIGDLSKKLYELIHEIGGIDAIMKNQYVGDIGDYGKYSLLKTFSDAGIRLGVNWYLTPDDGSNDGKFTKYLQNESMRKYDPAVYDVLQKIGSKPGKSVRDVMTSGLLPEAVFYDRELSPSGGPTERAEARKAWFEESKKVLADADLIFMDPDNGLLETGDVTHQNPVPKSTSFPKR